MPVKGLAGALVVANLALAVAQFAEPPLYGKAIDRLAQAQAAGVAPLWADLAPRLVA